METNRCHHYKYVWYIRTGQIFIPNRIDKNKRKLTGNDWMENARIYTARRDSKITNSFSFVQVRGRNRFQNRNNT